MAVTVITPTQLVLDTPSADILDSDGTVATTPADGFSIALGTRGRIGSLIIKLLADGSGDTVVFKAGDQPPAMRAGLGDLSVVLAASDVRYIVIESARFMQDDNTVLATCTDAGTSMRVFAMPIALDGGSAIA